MESVFSPRPQVVHDAVHMARILVTGGAGFVGSAVVDALLAGGDDVVALDDLATGDRANVALGVALIVADISDASALERALEGARFDAIVHCASRTKVLESIEKPDLYRRVIVDGTRNVLAVGSRCGARDFVNFSSGGVIYGETPACAGEDTPPAPISPYGSCKATAERLVEGSGLRAVTLRPANIYGPRQRTDLEGGVVAIFMRRWREREPVHVRGDGSMERDYVFVGDVARAVVAALRSPGRGVYNVGTGVATSINALVAAMTAVLGPSPGVEHVAELPGELHRSCVDPARAARELDWRPMTSLEEGLRITATAV